MYMYYILHYDNEVSYRKNYMRKYTCMYIFVFFKSCISRLAQFKPMLFKGLLYIKLFSKSVSILSGLRKFLTMICNSDFSRKIGNEVYSNFQRD